MADSNFGLKYSLHQGACRASTLQLRVYTPTGDVERGLGNILVAIEAAWLNYWRLSERTSLYAEISVWISLNGTPTFAGNVLRYGIGGSQLLNDSCCYPLSAVVEVVGWTVLEGRTAITTIPLTTTFPDATGDTIVNAKFGARLGVGHEWDVYAGYGFAISHEAWYDDVFRLEIRHTFQLGAASDQRTTLRGARRFLLAAVTPLDGKCIGETLSIAIRGIAMIDQMA